MRGLTFIHTCDLHLEEAHPERLEVLRWLLSAAAESEAALLICGDLFDSDSQARILRPAVRDVFNSYTGVDVFLLPGNHDAESYSGGEDYGQSVQALASRPLEVFDYNGVALAAAPFVRDSRLAAALTGVPALERPSILLAHGTHFGGDSSFWREARDKGMEYYPIHPEDLRTIPFAYAALGHFHSRFRKIEEGDVTLCYPGSPTPITAAETGIRKAAMVNIETESGAVIVEELLIGTGDYYIKDELDLLPGLEENAFSRVVGFLAENRSDRAAATILLSGITQWSDALINEKVEGLKQSYASFYSSLEIVNGIQSYEGLMENALVKEFVGRLDGEEDIGDEIRRLAAALGLRAFDAALSRKK